MFWLCKLCQKKRQLIVSCGSWLQGLPKNRNKKQTKELQKLIQKTNRITRTASYSQYEDLIDQVSLDESVVTSGDQDEEHEGEAEGQEEEEDEDEEMVVEDEEWRRHLITEKKKKNKKNTSFIKPHEHTIMKTIHQRRASEQLNLHDVTKSIHGLCYPTKGDQPVTTEINQTITGQKCVNVKNDDVDDDDIDRNINQNKSHKNSTYQQRLHLYFTKQMSQSFSVDDADDDDDEVGFVNDDVKSDHLHVHNQNNQSNETNHFKQSFSSNNQLPIISKHLNLQENYEELKMIDEIPEIKSAVIMIDENASKVKTCVQPTHRKIPLDKNNNNNNDQNVISLSTVSPTSILSDHRTDDVKQIIHDNNAETDMISSKDYQNTFYDLNAYYTNQHPDHSIQTNHNDMKSSYYENITESIHFNPFNDQDYLFEENSSKCQQNTNQLSMDNLIKMKMLNTCTQSQIDSTDEVGLIIPQHSDDETSEDMEKQMNKTDNNQILSIIDNQVNETRQLSQHENDPNFRHSQFNRQTRRQSCPLMINSELPSSSSTSSSTSSHQPISQKQSLKSQFSYSESVDTCNRYDDDDDDEKSTHFYNDQHDFYQPNDLYHHELNSNSLNLFFPYNLNNSWDYAEDLRKIDENIYQRTTLANVTTHEMINSSSSSSIYNESTSITSPENYYTNETLQSSIKNYANNFEPSMNDHYLNWLNELNSNYNYVINQEENLQSTQNYNMNQYDDNSTTQCSFINSTSSQDRPISSLITTSAANNGELIEQNLLLKRCPNFENISCLSNNNNNNGNNNDIESRSHFNEGSMQLSDAVNDEKDDLEMNNNDTPTKVWGREFRDRLQITTDSSTCLLADLFDDIKPELELWSNLFNTSEIVVDTAREISTQLNLLSTLEEEEEEEDNVRKQEERKILGEKLKTKAENQIDNNQHDKNSNELIDSRNQILVRTIFEKDKQDDLKDNEINENAEKHEITPLNNFSSKQYTAQIEDDTRLYNFDRTSTNLESQINTVENIISQPYNYEKSHKISALTNEKPDELNFLDTPTSTTYESNDSSSQKIVVTYQSTKFKSKGNQFPHTSSLPIDNKLAENNSVQREEKLENTTTEGDLCYSDRVELCDHVMSAVVNASLSLDNNNFSASLIQSPDDDDDDYMGEKNSVIHKTLYPYDQCEQQLTSIGNNQTYACIDRDKQQQYALINNFGEESSHLKSTNDYEERKSSSRKSNEVLPTSFLAYNNYNDESLNYPIDQSNSNNSQSSLHKFQYFNKFQTETCNEIKSNYDERNTLNSKQNEIQKFTVLNNLASPRSLEKSSCRTDVVTSELAQSLLTTSSCNRTTSICIGINQPTFTTSSSTLSFIKPFCCFNEKVLKRAQLILSNSPITSEPDPTDTLLALTDTTTTTNNNIISNFDRSHETNLCKSSIKNYFLSLSCPQSLSSQPIEDNYDTSSECSDFSIHVPISNSIVNENGSNESKLSSLLNFKEFYANRHLWEPVHSQWYIHILKRITEETLLTSIPEQSVNNENFPTEYMSSSSSSRGSYFTHHRRRPHSSAYSYEVNSLIDDFSGVYESPNSSSSVAYSGPSYKHRSLHDVYPDRSIKPLDDNYRTNSKLSSKSSLKHPPYGGDIQSYRSYSEAGTSYHQHHPQKEKTNLASIIRYDRRNKLGLNHHHSAGRLKHFKSNDIESVLQQRILKDSNRNAKLFPSTEFDKQRNSTYITTPRLNKNYEEYERNHRLKRGVLRSYTPTYKTFYTPQTKWSNDNNNNFLEVGSYFSLPLNDYRRKGTKHSRPTINSQHYGPEFSLHRKIPSDEWSKSDHLSRRIGNLSKSTGHLSHLDDLNRMSGCTSMQTLRARLAAAHSEFNLDNREIATDSFESQRLNDDRFGSLDRRMDSNDFTTRQLRRQIEQHHRRLLKSLMNDEPYETSWPSSFSNCDLQGYLNSYPNDVTEMQPTTLISSTLAPPIFSTASTRLPLNVEAGKIDDNIVVGPSNYLSTNDQQFLSVPNMLTTSNMNSTTPVLLSNQLPLTTNNVADNIMNSSTIINQPTSINLNEQMPISNNALFELINNPEFLQALSYNPTLINQLNSMCTDLEPADLNQVTLAAVAGAIAATAVAGSGMLDNSNNNNNTIDNINNINTCQPTNQYVIDSLLQHINTSDQMNTGNVISNNNTNTDLINNVSSINSNYLNTMNLPKSHLLNEGNDGNISRMNTTLPKENGCLDAINPESIDVLIEQVRKLLAEQNNCDLINPTSTISSMGNNISSNMPSTNTNNQLISSLPSSLIHQTNPSIMTGQRVQPPLNRYCENNQYSSRHLHNQPVINQQQQQQQQQSHIKTPSETVDNWLGLSEDEWNYKNYKDNAKNSNSWTDGNTTWPIFNPLISNKPRSLVQPTKCIYDFPTKRLLLMRESKDRHQRGGGIGMRIVGGHIRSDGNLGAFVEEIYPSGPADQLHGEIKEGNLYESKIIYY
ncbi:unnamed protein product [Schistosoma turkestanicum]|nr:unnamed protein product [Schistosoma turkestanicum]